MVTRTTIMRKYPRMEASLIISIRVMKMPTFARFPEVRSRSNHKVYYMLKYYILALVSGKFLLLLKMKILFTEYAQLTSLEHVRVSDEWTFKRVLVVEHNAHKKIRDKCFQKKKMITLKLSFFCIACSWKTAIEIVYLTTFVECVEIGII